MAEEPEKTKDEPKAVEPKKDEAKPEGKPVPDVKDEPKAEEPKKGEPQKEEAKPEVKPAPDVVAMPKPLVDIPGILARIKSLPDADSRRLYLNSLSPEVLASLFGNPDFSDCVKEIVKTFEPLRVSEARIHFQEYVPAIQWALLHHPEFMIQRNKIHDFPEVQAMFDPFAGSSTWTNRIFRPDLTSPPKGIGFDRAAHEICTRAYTIGAGMLLGFGLRMFFGAVITTAAGTALPVLGVAMATGAATGATISAIHAARHYDRLLPNDPAKKDTKSKAIYFGTAIVTGAATGALFADIGYELFPTIGGALHNLLGLQTVTLTPTETTTIINNNYYVYGHTNLETHGQFVPYGRPGWSREYAYWRYGIKDHFARHFHPR